MHIPTWEIHNFSSDTIIQYYTVLNQFFLLIKIMSMSTGQESLKYFFMEIVK